MVTHERLLKVFYNRPVLFNRNTFVLIRLLIILILATSVFGGAYYAVRHRYFEPARKLVEDKKLPPPTPPPDPSMEEFTRCEDIRRTAPPAEARTAFERFLKEFPESKKRDAVLDAIGEINSTEFFATKPDDTNTYTVKPGDSLGRIASRTKISLELLAHLNRLKSETLHPGQRLLAPVCGFRLVLQQRARRIAIYRDDKFFRQYPTLAWPGANKKPVIILPKQSGKVTEKIAINEKGGVKPTDLAFFSARHVLMLSIPGHSLYGQSDDPAATAQRPAGAGIALTTAAMSEIAVLIPKGAPVTME